MEDINYLIQDESEDKKYFTIVPNFILNHSTATDQALYLHMKRYAGEKGTCFASEATLKEQLGVGSKALKKSIKYLIEHKWISYVGYKVVQTEGGPQKVKTYKMNDLWKMNIDYYEGVAKREPLEQRGVQKDTKGVRFQATKKNKREEEPKEATLSVAGIREGINLFKEVNPSYERLFNNTTERAAMERLIAKHGKEMIFRSIQALPKYLAMPGCPQITTPYQFERKLGQLVIFAKQQNSKTKQKVFVIK